MIMAWQDTSDGKRKLWYNEHGICRDCGQREVEPNTQLCFECAERKYKKAKEYYRKHRDEINERNKQTAKKDMPKEKQAEFALSAENIRLLKTKRFALIAI